MKLDKAIEILSGELSAPTQVMDLDLQDACKLGLQAMYRIKYRRDLQARLMVKLLPGETEI